MYFCTEQDSIDFGPALFFWEEEYGKFAKVF